MNELNIRNLCLADFGYNFNKTRQRFSDVILQEGRRPYRYSDASQKITSELAEVKRVENKHCDVIAVTFVLTWILGPMEF